MAIKDIAAGAEVSIASAYKLHAKIADGLTDEQIIATPKGRRTQGVTETKNKISQLLLRNSAMTQAEISAKFARDEITLTQSGC